MPADRAPQLSADSGWPDIAGHAPITPSKSRRPRSVRWHPGAAALLAIVLVGAAARVYWNNVEAYATSDHADETAYLLSAQALSRDPSGYPAIVRAYLAHPAEQVDPPPVRWGGLIVTVAACEVAPCTYRTLAWVETLAGIAAIALIYAVARRLSSRSVGLLAAAFAVTSPIQLGMGRRALEDCLFLVAVLLALWSTLLLVERRNGTAWWIAHGAAVAAFAFAFAVKESFFIYYAALALVLLAARREIRPRIGDVAVFALAPVVYVAVFGALSGDVRQILDFARIAREVIDAPYVIRFQSGPPFEPLIDLFVLAPVVSLLAVGSAGVALAHARRREVSGEPLVLFTLALLVAYAFVPKDARYFMPGDAAFRMLAAWGIVTLAPAGRTLLYGLASIAVNAISEIAIFTIVFVEAGVYDPVLANLLDALHLIPH